MELGLDKIALADHSHRASHCWPSQAGVELANDDGDPDAISAAPLSELTSEARKAQLVGSTG